jgi:putative Mg2+ transporter-C (MgtC) family protein
MDLTNLPGFALPLLAAVVAGGLIGFEREWRGRAAGFRTHILVCLASSLLMAAAVSQADWSFSGLPGSRVISDPTRMAHGVLTGIGFLCAGVIFRSGFSIHGLTTAASLWITAAIGMLFGTGLFLLGAVGTLMTMAVLTVLRLISLRLPQALVVDAIIAWRRDAAGAEDRVEAALAGIDRHGRSGRFELIDGGSEIRRSFRLKLDGEPALKALSARLRGIDGVTLYSLEPRDD